MKSWKNVDPWSGMVILLTAGLFVLSLIVKGLTHDLFLESAVFLVSVKLILMAGKQAASEERLETHLQQIKELLATSKAANSATTSPAPSSAASSSEERKKL